MAPLAKNATEMGRSEMVQTAIQLKFLIRLIRYQRLQPRKIRKVESTVFRHGLSIKPVEKARIEMDMAVIPAR